MKIVTQNLCQTWCHHMLMHFSIKHWLQHRCIQVLAIGTKKVQVIHLNTSGSFDLSWHIYGHFVDWGHLGYSRVIIGERKWRVHCLTSGKHDWVTTWPPPKTTEWGKSEPKEATQWFGMLTLWQLWRGSWPVRLTDAYIHLHEAPL